MRIALIILLIFLVNAGCSVGMAMSGKDSPNLALVRVGATRGEIELTMGKAVKTISQKDGSRIDVYEYEVGNDPSAARATGHAVMDLLTFGLWEIVGTPMEGFQGDDHKLSITYDKDDVATAVKGN